MSEQSRLIDRHFWPVICVLFAALLLPLLFREWQSLRTVSMHDVEWHTTALADLLQRDIEPEHDLLGVLDRLDRPEYFQLLDQHVLQKIGHLGLVKLKIFDPDGTIIYCNDASLVGKVKSGKQSIHKALAGSIVSKSISPAKYLGEYGEATEIDMAEVYVPIRTGSGEKIRYVLEAYYDYSPILERARTQMLKNSLGLLLAFAVILGLLAYLHKGKQRLLARVKRLEAEQPSCRECGKPLLQQPLEAEQWENMDTFLLRQEQNGLCRECRERLHS